MIQSPDEAVVLSLTVPQIVSIAVAVFAGMSPLLVLVLKTGKRIAVGENRLEKIEDAIERLEEIVVALESDLKITRAETRNIRGDIDVERRVVARLAELHLLEEETDA